MGMKDEEVMERVVRTEPVVWLNENIKSAQEGLDECCISKGEMYEGENRLQKFAPLIKKLFPETGDGIIESPLVQIENMRKELEKYYEVTIQGNVYLKCDSHLKVAGSIKARGGIYEVLKHAEELALSSGMLKKDDDYVVLSEGRFKKLFSQYKIAVGSTGNLGLSIGIISSALGFKVTVHMSKDAKKWKKQLLRSKGVNVIEYNDDYSKAVEEGRKQCEKDPSSYFVDDENSKDLFIGYSVAALRLQKQLASSGITVDNMHRLNVYLPCGVGGAAGGITFGLKHIFGDNVKCYFAEPTHSPSMLIGLLTKKYDKIHVKDYGIDNVTEADGLAVGSPSKLVSKVASLILDGEYTVEDYEFFKLLAMLRDSENIKVEVSAAAGLIGPAVINGNHNTTHIVWATGGLLVPDDVYARMYQKGKMLLSAQ